MVYNCKDQVVLITGAATGIGAAVVKLVVEEGAKHVAVLDIAEREGIELQNKLNSACRKNIVKFYKCDVTEEEVFMGIFTSVQKDQGYIDVLINNAGIMNDRPNVVKKEININVTALVLGTLRAIEIMRKDKGGQGGTVINISSIAGLLQLPLLPIYFATKSAVLQFSNCIGMKEHYERTGVRVLAICFGATNSALLTAQKLGSFDPDYENDMLKGVQSFEFQSIESAAKGLVEAYKLGESGTTWLIANDTAAQNISDDVKKGYETMSSKLY